MEETVNERIKKIISHYENNKPSQFSAKTGIPASTLSGIIGKRQAEPSYDVLRKIVETYDKLNAEWLMRGIGEIEKNADTLGSEQPSKDSYINFLEKDVAAKEAKAEHYRKQMQHYIGIIKKGIPGFDIEEGLDKGN